MKRAAARYSALDFSYSHLAGNRRQERLQLTQGGSGRMVLAQDIRVLRRKAFEIDILALASAPE
jgi:hypothetical protein